MSKKTDYIRSEETVRMCRGRICLFDIEVNIMTADPFVARTRLSAIVRGYKIAGSYVSRIESGVTTIRARIND